MPDRPPVSSDGAWNNRLTEVREHLRRAHSRLEDPSVEQVDQCRRELEEAVALLQGVPDLLPAGHRVSRVRFLAAAQGVRRELVRVRALLESAAAFHLGWRNLRASLVSGYTAQGVPAALPGSPRVSWAG